MSWMKCIVNGSTLAWLYCVSILLSLCINLVACMWFLISSHVVHFALYCIHLEVYMMCFTRNMALALLQASVSCSNTAFEQVCAINISHDLAAMLLQPNAASGIANPAYIVVLGLLTACWSFTGYDAAAHLIEETIAADATAGWPMLYAISISFAVGLSYILVLTASIQVSLSETVFGPCQVGPSDFQMLLWVVGNLLSKGRES